ncbi:hypothetical protein CYMTET_23135, partial [Cymbomonas tetramitiformis]
MQEAQAANSTELAAVEKVAAETASRSRAGEAAAQEEAREVASMFEKDLSDARQEMEGQLEQHKQALVNAQEELAASTTKQQQAELEASATKLDMMQQEMLTWQTRAGKLEKKMKRERAEGKERGENTGELERQLEEAQASSRHSQEQHQAWGFDKAHSSNLNILQAELALLSEQTGELQQSFMDLRNERDELQTVSEARLTELKEATLQQTVATDTVSLEPQLKTELLEADARRQESERRQDTLTQELEVARQQQQEVARWQEELTAMQLRLDEEVKEKQALLTSVADLKDSLQTMEEKHVDEKEDLQKSSTEVCALTYIGGPVTGSVGLSLYRRPGGWQLCPLSIGGWLAALASLSFSMG